MATETGRKCGDEGSGLTEIDVIKKRRAAVRGIVKSAASEAKKLFDEKNYDRFDIKRTVITEKMDELKELDKELQDLLLWDETISENDMLNEMEDAVFYFELGTSVLNMVKEEKQAKSVYKLPKLEFQKYELTPETFIQWWGQFRRIYDDRSLAVSEKFQYLRMTLLEDTKARKMIEAYPMDDNNFEKAVGALKSRFGRDEYQIEIYTRKIISLMNQHKKDLLDVFDKLSSYLMALEAVGMTFDRCAFMLYPIVESCLPADTLQEWERYRCRNEPSLDDSFSTGENHSPLQALMDFLQAEVRSRERILLAQPSEDPNSFAATAAALSNVSKSISCLFCGPTAKHFSSDCRKALNISIEERRNRVMASKSCLQCLKRGHLKRFCRTQPTCTHCSGEHVSSMCTNHSSSNVGSTSVDNEKQAPLPTATTSVLHIGAKHNESVYLKTIVVEACHNGKVVQARALLDDGSQRSYVSNYIIDRLNLHKVGEELLSHGLFGGAHTRPAVHGRYEVVLKNTRNQNSVDIVALGSETICGNLPRINDKQLFASLSKRGIILTDVGDGSAPIDILLGADVLGQVLTGRIEKMDKGITAIETTLGWSVLGSSSNVKSLVAMSLFAIPDLWDLEQMGICDPIARIEKAETNADTLAHFEENIKFQDSRYVVKLPWVEGHPPIRDNKNQAIQRLQSVTNRLKEKDLFVDYDAVLRRWEADGIIENVPEASSSSRLCYLPHRPVIREGKTTRIRPVFDPSMKTPGQVSLNECLCVGPNLTQNIVPLLTKFRIYKFGVTADIKQAFQMIVVEESDRDALRFLWWSDLPQEIKIYRHSRVPFGLSCSPFLLNATLSHHLSNPDFQCASLVDTVELLKRSFYVDDAILSLPSEEEVSRFKRNATHILSLGGFELRQWTYSNMNNEESSVLGIKWKVQDDTLKLAVPSLDFTGKLSKRSLLSLISRIYDPLGFTAAAMIPVKRLLQEAFKRKCTWTEELPGDLLQQLRSWLDSFHFLSFLTVPRQLSYFYPVDVYNAKVTIHILSDGSSYAYGAAVFLRCEDNGRVSVQLIIAKAKVAPLSKNTIPRLELLGACVGVRLYNSIRDIFPMAKPYFWSDSMVTLWWIKRKEPWNTFVGNRVKEIRESSNVDDWRHVPGDQNKEADLLSRGCTFEALLHSKFWEGPAWLKDSETTWPTDKLSEPSCAADERRKTVSVLSTFVESSSVCTSLIKHCSTYLKAKRVCAWILRFYHNVRNPTDKLNGDLSFAEITKGELSLLKALQSEWPEGDKQKLFTQMKVDTEEGLYKIQTKLVQGADVDEFQRPILLPENPVTKLMVREAHITLGHCGVGTMLTYLRTKFWIHRARKMAREIVHKCTVCRRFKSRPVTAVEASLPPDRTANVPVFLHSGCDMAGPLYLQGGGKAYVLIFTCCVYRAVHLELVSSLSADCFVLGLRRFIARRGRCSLLRSDNGGNFVAVSRALRSLDWTVVETQSNIMKIQWKFNVPGAPWWTGFVERMVGLVKTLLRTCLGQALLNYEELNTILHDCESTINSRPLTYLSDDPSELTPLTPAHYLLGNPCTDVTDIDILDSSHLLKRYNYLQALRDQLRKRFRNEYLAELVRRSQVAPNKTLSVGDVVLVGAENTKRLNWPLGLITEVLSGQDGIIRAVRVKMTHGELLRPVQKIFPLEVSGECSLTQEPGSGEPDGESCPKQPEVEVAPEDPVSTCEPVLTRSGRRVVPPRILNL